MESSPRWRAERMRRSSSRLNTESLKLKRSGTAVAKVNTRRNSHHWSGLRSRLSMVNFLRNGVHQVFIGQFGEQFEQVVCYVLDGSVVFVTDDAAYFGYFSLAVTQFPRTTAGAVQRVIMASIQLEQHNCAGGLLLERALPVDRKSTR